MGEAVREKIKAFWSRIADFHQDRLIGLIWSGDQERLRRALSAAFDEGKKLSDFIGMIVRMVFVLFAALFLLKSASLTGGLQGFALGIGGIYAGAVTAFLASSVFRIILLWNLTWEDWGDAAPWNRAILVSLSILSAVAVGVGVWSVVEALAKASDLLR